LDQVLLFQVWDIDNEKDKELIGELTVLLSEVMNSTNYIYSGQLSKNGKGSGTLHCKADPVKQS